MTDYVTYDIIEAFHLIWGAGVVLFIVAGVIYLSVGDWLSDRRKRRNARR